MDAHVCPVWAGYLLASPVRKLVQNPKNILGPYVREGMTVLDIGSAMGFFSLPLARLVGPRGSVICVDLQQPMLARLQQRARKAGLLERIETRLCQRDSLGLADLRGAVDFALAFAVVHEVPDPSRLFRETYEALKPAGRLLLAEPKGRVSQSDFAATVSVAEHAGFSVIGTPRVRRSRAALLEKKTEPQPR
jgi:2-polyprenyl-3-methyl-5-hydroxy-6-metoxy-1,4-benzoquinol methylase